MSAAGSRILINCLSAGSGGALSYIRNLLPRLLTLSKAQDNPTQFIFLYNRQLSSLFVGLPREACIEVDPAWSSTPFKRLLWEKRHLNELLSAHSIEVMFVPAQFSALTRGVRSIYLIGNMEPFFFRSYSYAPAKWLRNALLAPLSRRVLSSADRVIAISEFSKGYCRESIGIPEERLSLIYHGRDLGFAPERTERDGDVLAKFELKSDYLFTCGSMLPYRRFEDVIQAYRLLTAERKDLPPLILAGGQEDSRYSRLINAMIRDSLPRGAVRHIGKLTRDEMQVLYRNSLLFVMSSEIEACPIVAIEAMTSGCTIIACSKPPEPEMFQDAAVFYPARDERALAEHIVELLDNPDKREVLSSRALQRAKFFSWDKCADETFAALTKPFD